jgi:hypothetical protein
MLPSILLIPSLAVHSRLAGIELLNANPSRPEVVELPFEKLSLNSIKLLLVEMRSPFLPPSLEAFEGRSAAR